ncbi:2-amino-4-hydroxy-6-hydroxymethyldihydropteridine diphosphokinase [Gemmobacter aquarius]|uniref:2-amino-4-hydroxy-6-hydroxymethyldihydropteridine pyrophosphokinase n=1 Tax=Paragemmobacter aquarius TaxID=2169400 RepID=A0A2S0UNU0_9RHOB|nr:2-amino-4-hydroxy-6-hydroxymethyldihydropteridine diphosphokinase [Gemmobacter aquarius]AWB49484.1 2-amino-4-hydroxy-6-hydroxymethyldihydropteridine diphosphokinase [Gemmobacter aquarius]
MESHEDQLLVALGANLPIGDQTALATLQRAAHALGSSGLTLNFSTFYATPCFPQGAGPDYVNAAAAGPIPQGWDAARVLALLHRIEDDFGRKRDQRWGMRTLDLDLVAFGNSVLPDAATQTRWRDLDPEAQRSMAPDRLILPHPRLQDRAFVLVPLADVAPDWRHPLLGQTTLEMLAALPATDRDQVVPIPL